MNLKWPRTAFHYWKAPMKGCFVGLQSTSYTVCFNRNCFTAAPANVNSIIIRDVVSVSTSRSRDGLETYPTSRLVSTRRNFPISRSRLGLESERLGSRLGLGHEGLVSIPDTN